MAKQLRGKVREIREVVKQLRLGPSDSMDILNYLSLGRAKLSTVMRSEAIGTWGQESGSGCDGLMQPVKA